MMWDQILKYAPIVGSAILFGLTWWKERSVNKAKLDADREMTIRRHELSLQQDELRADLSAGAAALDAQRRELFLSRELSERGLEAFQTEARKQTQQRVAEARELYLRCFEIALRTCILAVKNAGPTSEDAVTLQISLTKARSVCPWPAKRPALELEKAIRQLVQDALAAESKEKRDAAFKEGNDNVAVRFAEYDEAAELWEIRQHNSLLKRVLRAQGFPIPDFLDGDDDDKLAPADTPSNETQETRA